MPPPPSVIKCNIISFPCLECLEVDFLSEATDSLEHRTVQLNLLVIILATAPSEAYRPKFEKVAQIAGQFGKKLADLLIVNTNFV